MKFFFLVWRVLNKLCYASHYIQFERFCNVSLSLPVIFCLGDQTDDTTVTQLLYARLSLCPCPVHWVTARFGSGLHEKVTWNKNNLLEGKRKAGWKVKQRDYNIQKANILSFLACVQTPPSPQIFSEGRRGVGHLYTGYSFQGPLYCLPSSKVLLYHVTVFCKGPIWAVSTLMLTCRLQVTLLILLGQHWPRLYKLTNSVSLTGFAPCAIPTGNLVVSFWQLKYSVIPIWLTQRRDMKLFSCKKTENQSHHNQSLISCGHCVRRKWDY